MRKLSCIGNVEGKKRLEQFRLVAIRSSFCTSCRVVLQIFYIAKMEIRHGNNYPCILIDLICILGYQNILKLIFK